MFNQRFFKTFFLPIILVVCGSVFNPDAHAQEMKVYRPGDWKPLLESRANKPMIVHFWGFTCSPCLDELPHWGDFIAQFPEVKTVFIEVDQIPAELSIQTLRDARLDRADHRTSSASFDEYMRYEIDPRWMGELPLTMLISPKGEIRRLRGTVDFKIIRQWLAQF